MQNPRIEILSALTRNKISDELPLKYWRGYPAQYTLDGRKYVLASYGCGNELRGQYEIIAAAESHNREVLLDRTNMPKDWWDIYLLDVMLFAEAQWLQKKHALGDFVVFRHKQSNTEMILQMPGGTLLIYYGKQVFTDFLPLQENLQSLSSIPKIRYYVLWEIARKYGYSITDFDFRHIDTNALQSFLAQVVKPVSIEQDEEVLLFYQFTKLPCEAALATQSLYRDFLKNASDIASTVVLSGDVILQTPVSKSGKRVFRSMMMSLTAKALTEQMLCLDNLIDRYNTEKRLLESMTKENKVYSDTTDNREVSGNLARGTDTQSIFIDNDTQYTQVKSCKNSERIYGEKVADTSCPESELSRTTETTDINIEQKRKEVNEIRKRIRAIKSIDDFSHFIFLVPASITAAKTGIALNAIAACEEIVGKIYRACYGEDITIRE